MLEGLAGLIGMTFLTVTAAWPTGAACPNLAGAVQNPRLALPPSSDEDELGTLVDRIRERATTDTRALTGTEYRVGISLILILTLTLNLTLTYR